MAQGLVAQRAGQLTASSLTAVGAHNLTGTIAALPRRPAPAGVGGGIITCLFPCHQGLQSLPFQI